MFAIGPEQSQLVLANHVLDCHQENFFTRGTNRERRRHIVLTESRRATPFARTPQGRSGEGNGFWRALNRA